MRIGEFARQLGVHPDTVRRLERRGLLPTMRDWAGQRRFVASDLERARRLLFGRGAQLGDRPPAQASDTQAS